ncbi:hypothetical protein MMC28_001673 [Mycoblastus sanguinarius]|nr:hypothetical protein [Mycoblastus sanguinarius]
MPTKRRAVDTDSSSSDPPTKKGRKNRKRHASRPADAAEDVFKESELYDYVHCPLVHEGDIRVLTIRQGSNKQPIECWLKTHSLTDGQEHATYEALSYHWGTDEPTLTIKIYTGGFPQDFMVRPNLLSALQQLRLPHSPRTLWIDAICINQKDTDEQNHQVSLMAKVYSRATNVCVWLGESSKDSDLALNFISRIVNLDDFDRLVVDRRTPEEWAALSSLMKREWFSRRWVVQEIALAKRATLYCGEDYVGWADFADAVSLFEAAESEGRVISKSLMRSDLYNHIPDFFGEIKFLGATRLVDATSNLFRKSTDGQVLERLLSLEALISNLAAFQASRAHDIIYAVLQLAKGVKISAKPKSDSTDVPENELPSSSVPTELPQKEHDLAKHAAAKFRQAADEGRWYIDYDRPFFEVCQHFLSSTIKSSKSLDIICRPWIPEEADLGGDRPSWLLTTSQTAYGRSPDGNFRRKNADTLVGTPGLGKRNYNASGPTKVTEKWRFGEGSKARSMYVEGFIIDSIPMKGKNQYAAGKFPSAADGIILDKWLTAGGWSDTSALPPDPFWRTLVADRGPNGLNPPPFYPRACKAALNQSVKGGHISTNTLVHNGKSSVVAKFLRRVQEVIWMRRLVITEHQLLGLVPEETKKYDLICILYGCSVPVVLRKLEDPATSEEYFEFVGECYVHGIMDGEAFALQRKRSLDGKIKKEIFELR